MSVNRMNPLEVAKDKHNFVFIGEAGSGKSEVAINFALSLLKGSGKAVHFYDLDMTKPLFRSRDHARTLTQMGLNFHFEEQFMDAPTIAGGVYRLMRNEDCCTVLDVGGDYIGARSIGGYAPMLNAPGTIVWYVVNPYRPWSLDIEHIDKILSEILGVSHIQLDKLRILGNPNLGPDTSPCDVISGAEKLIEMITPYKPVDFFCAREEIADELNGYLPSPLFPICLYLTYEWAEK